MVCLCILFFFFKQKTAYEMRISDWSSDVCSSDLGTIACPEIKGKGCEPSVDDRGAQIGHQRFVEPDIMLGHQHRAQDLAPAAEVVEIGAAPPATPPAGPCRIERALILAVSGRAVCDSVDSRCVGHGCVSTCKYRLVRYP